MSTQLHPILVGIDGTPAGLEALALGGALAVLNGAPLVLGAVWGYDGDVWPPQSSADRWLDEAEQRLGDAIPWTTETMLSTSPGHGLTTLAQRADASWIALGSSHRGPVGRVLMGSTARSVINGAPCGVAVVPHGWRLRPPEAALRFGVAFTNAPEAREALVSAARLADAARAPLRVYTVVPIPSPAHPMFAATGTSYQDWRRDERRDAERLAAAAVAPATSTEIIVLDGEPVSCLAEISGDLDLLFVGSRRYGPLRRALLGGVSAPLLDRAHCPVLVVPRAAHTEPVAEEAGVSTAHA
jgi:nucleotide-binding universal stress UspA family protein